MSTVAGCNLALQVCIDAYNTTKDNLAVFTNCVYELRTCIDQYRACLLPDRPADWLSLCTSLKLKMDELAPVLTNCISLNESDVQNQNMLHASFITLISEYSLVDLSDEDRMAIEANVEEFYRVLVCTGILNKTAFDLSSASISMSYGMDILQFMNLAPNIFLN